MKAVQGKRAVIVGTFIVIGIIILMAGIFTLGSQRKTFSNGIPIKAIFDNVNGLQAGNNIWFSGVKVGAVRRLQLVDGAKVEVDMNIDSRSRRFIHRDAKVKIGSDGLIGNKIVVIYGGTPGSATIAPESILQNESVLGTDEIMNTLQENNKNLLAITGAFKLISQHLVNGDGTIGRLLTNDDLLNQLQSTAVTLQKASANIQLLTANVADYTSKLQNRGTLTNELVSDTSLFETLKQASSKIQQASEDAQQLTANLNSVSQRIKDSSNMIGVLLHDQQTAANFKATVDNLQSGTAKFNEDMEALQHNFLFRGFFRKKDKQQKEQQKKAMVNDK